MVDIAVRNNCFNFVLCEFEGINVKHTGEGEFSRDLFAVEDMVIDSQLKIEC